MSSVTTHYVVEVRLMKVTNTITYDDSYNKRGEKKTRDVDEMAHATFTDRELDTAVTRGLNVLESHMSTQGKEIIVERSMGEANFVPLAGQVFNTDDETHI